MTNTDTDTTRRSRREGGGRRGGSSDGRSPVQQLPRRKLKRLFPAMEIVSAEIEMLSSVGVEIVTDTVVGQLTSVPELLGEEGFDAVFVGSGAGLPVFMGIPGENLNGVYSANEFLTRVNLM
ncbi:MAG: hypothetical protein WCG38_17875, partial [Aestuariivirga sp.]